MVILSQMGVIVYSTDTKIKKVTILIEYVDDIIITGNDPKERTKLEQELVEEFSVKNLGIMKYFLEIEVVHSSKGITLS